MQITIREPASAITHFIGMLLAVFAAVPLLVKAGVTSGGRSFTAMTVFMASMILLYGASAAYHSVNLTGKALQIFQKLDHMMIFVLIAGSYTPVCLIVLNREIGYRLLAIVWGIALGGMLINACWITCPKWFSSLIYISMGWVCVLVFGQLFDTLSTAAFLWLLAGGRHHLRPETAHLQCKAQRLRFPRSISPVRHGREHLPFYFYVPVRGLKGAHLLGILPQDLFSVQKPDTSHFATK